MDAPYPKAEADGLTGGQRARHPGPILGDTGKDKLLKKQGVLVEA